MHQLVAYCTTSMQTPAPAIFRVHSTAQSFGCGCAKATFPTTTNTKQKRVKENKPTLP